MVGNFKMATLILRRIRKGHIPQKFLTLIRDWIHGPLKLLKKLNFSFSRRLSSDDLKKIKNLDHSYIG